MRRTLFTSLIIPVLIPVPVLYIEPVLNIEVVLYIASHVEGVLCGSIYRTGSTVYARIEPQSRIEPRLE